MSSEDGTINAILSGDIDCLTWPCARAIEGGAWQGHVSFAHWLVQAARPRVIVELGTYMGVSFAAFCQSVQRGNIPAHCYAVDTWQGDAHAGLYEDDVFIDLNAFMTETNYASFGTLLRSLFDDALPRFEDGSIDLLHIDGLHTYEAAQHDFLTWLPKMSGRGIILFHDIAARIADFGVWKLWAELIRGYPHFTFHHSSGLGVLAVGQSIPPAVAALCALEGTPGADAVRATFARLSDNAHSLHDHDRQTQLRSKLRSLGKNIALHCRTFQSSTHSEPGGSLDTAVNGLKTGRYGFHTAFEINPWWVVDLGRAKTFSDIVVYNRLDRPCARRARTLRVSTSVDLNSWTPIYEHDGSTFGGADGRPLHIKCPATTARFVRMQLNEKNYLHLDEVEIYSAG